MGFARPLLAQRQQGEEHRLAGAPELARLGEGVDRGRIGRPGVGAERLNPDQIGPDQRIGLADRLEDRTQQ
jgi:hypothetical protein